MDAQTNLSPRWAHMSERTFSHVVAYGLGRIMEPYKQFELYAHLSCCVLDVLLIFKYFLITNGHSLDIVSG